MNQRQSAQYNVSYGQPNYNLSNDSHSRNNSNNNSSHVASNSGSIDGNAKRQVKKSPMPPPRPSKSDLSKHEGFILVDHKEKPSKQTSHNTSSKRDPITNLFDNRSQSSQETSIRKSYDNQPHVFKRNSKTPNSSGSLMKRAPIVNIENCTNCFKKFHFFSKRLECQLCNFSFCGSCSLIKNYKQAETGEVVRHRLCHQCEKTLTDLDQKKKTNEQIINANIDSYMDPSSAIQARMQHEQQMYQQHHKIQRNLTERYQNRNSRQVQWEKLPEDDNDDLDEQEEEEEEEVEDSAQPQELVDKQFDQKLRNVRKNEGVEAASQLLVEKQAKMKSMFKARQEEEEREEQSQTNKSLSRILKQQANMRQHRASFGENLDTITEDQMSEDDVYYQHDQMQQDLIKYLDDIRERTLKEFKIDARKWSSLLATFVEKAIKTVKPSSFTFKDSIDITDYVKIQLVKYKDNSKSKYVDGVVLKKSIAHKRMKKSMDNPRILLLSNSLGYIKDEQDFLDLETEIKQEDFFIHIIMNKIQLVKPDIIFVHKEASLKAIQALLAKDIILVTNVKKKQMERLERLTQTINCPSTNILSKEFEAGKCGRFFMETLAMRSLEKTVENNTNLIQLEGCLPFLGCTLILSGNDLNELKIVKHALKKILRLSRQLILENEYYLSLNISMMPSPNGENEQQSPYLHSKHMERSSLLFKEVSFAKRGVITQSEQTLDDNMEEHDPQGNKRQNNPAANQTEKEVQSKIQHICQAPQMKRVEFYQAEKNDISLVCKLRQLCLNSVQKCKNEHCDQYQIYHTQHYYHKNGYVEMKMRFSKEVPQDPKYQAPKVRQNFDKDLHMQCQCESCKVNVYKKELVSKQLQEMSFYSFLEQFFYNNESVQILQEDQILVEKQQKKCPHAFHRHCKIIFLIDIVRIEFQYHPVDIYELDLICFKDLQGSQTKEQELEKFQSHKHELGNQLAVTINYLRDQLKSLGSWLSQVGGLTVIAQPELSILQNLSTYIEKLDSNIGDYNEKAQEFLQNYESSHEFHLNKIHKSFTSRVSDYIHIMKSTFNMVFEELIPHIQNQTKGSIPNTKKYSKKDHATVVNQMIVQNQNQLNNRRATVMPKKDSNKPQKFEDVFRRAETQAYSSKLQHSQSIIEQPTADSNSLSDNSKFNLADLLEFQERLKKNPVIEKFMELSPSIPNGFNMNCTNVNLDDFSTIICQALLSNEHLVGLKEQGYMNLEQKTEKYTHPSVWEDKEFLKLKENQDVFNKEISLKEIETELLRLDHHDFHINFNTYKGPNSSELTIMKSGNSNPKSFHVEKTVISDTAKSTEILEQIEPSDLEASYYQDINKISTQLHNLKNTTINNDTARDDIVQSEKYLIHSIFYPKAKADIGIKIYFPSHFQALRKMYCGKFDFQLEHLFKSDFWADNTGGKSKSEFYKSINEKYIMKVINPNEMKMFQEFAHPYFEYMCRSFNQKCPTSIGKILGAFKINIRLVNERRTPPWHVVLMENLTVGINPKSLSLTKYDLKGSMSRRYVDAKTDRTVTRLDTNFLEDHNSRPICMNYTLHSLMEIAIHNDTHFLGRHEKIDYSFLVWIDHAQKLIRVGIIDYIQYYSIEKLLESKIKMHILNQGGKAPTILKPVSYQQRFQEAQSNYFMSILDDQPIKSFATLAKQQKERKRLYEARLPTSPSARQSSHQNAIYKPEPQNNLSTMLNQIDTAEENEQEEEAPQLEQY